MNAIATARFAGGRAMVEEIQESLRGQLVAAERSHAQNDEARVRRREQEEADVAGGGHLRRFEDDEADDADAEGYDCVGQTDSTQGTD